MIYQTSPPLKAHLLCYIHSPHTTSNMLLPAGTLALGVEAAGSPFRISCGPLLPSLPSCSAHLPAPQCPKLHQSHQISMCPVLLFHLSNLIALCAFTTYIKKKKKRESDEVIPLVMQQCLCFCCGNSGLSKHSRFWCESMLSGDLHFSSR